MSEFQYYEFRAIDRPLDKKAQAALRAITSRAEITSTSLVNVYHFGDFKGNPRRLMEQYFDVFFYYANWGTHRLMLRLPRRLFDLARAQPYLNEESVGAWETAEHVIFDFQSRDEGGDFYEEDEESLSELPLLRNELIAGDLRCLYLAWLSGLDYSDDTEEEEPPVPPGLKELSGPLERFADFLRVDQDLLEIAAERSAHLKQSEPGVEELTRWVGAMPEAEKTQLLVRAMQGEAAQVGPELLQRFLHEQSRTKPKTGAGPDGERPRTVEELLAQREQNFEERQRKEKERQAEERERQARDKAEARKRYLDGWAGKEETLWDRVEQEIATKQPKHYDQAVAWLKDLRELAQREGKIENFQARLQLLRDKHRNKPSLMERLHKAGLE